MAGGKQTPRQRMMGILYLVLLGLVALSIPDSLLDAFKNIKLSLESSTDNVAKGIDATFENFKATKLKEQPVRAKPILYSAERASKIARDLYNYVEDLKQQLIKEGGGINPTTNDVDARENVDISPRIMITDKKAEELKAKILETRDRLLNSLDAKDRSGVKFSLNAVDPAPIAGVSKKWEEAYFGDGVPLGATLTTLAKVQTDTKSAENEVVKKILGKIDVAVVTLDTFIGVAVAPTSYVIAGQPYTADIFLTAYDAKSSPEISINGSPIQAIDGKGKYTVNTSKEGVFSYKGQIRVKGPNGYKTYDLPEQKYQVAAPSAVVKPDKMNVLYIGVPNPMSISAPGIDKANLVVSMTGGSITGAAGVYTANVKEIGEAKITVSGVITKGGKSATFGTSIFRVKRIPDPKAVFAGKSGGSTGAANIRAQDRVFAKLDNFDFDAKFNVTRFTLILIKPRQDAISLTTSGGELSAQMKAAMSGVAVGTTIVFKDIIAVGPDGTQRGLDPIVLTAN
jgi:gliding motility-associated protein GldM